MAQMLILGIDVGGTSTDAVLLNDQGYRAKAKVATSDDVQGSISNVISSIRDQCDEGAYPARACLVDGTEGIRPAFNFPAIKFLELCLLEVASCSPLMRPEHHACRAGLQQVGLVCLGTTQFINALVRHEDLAQVAVLRLCGPATRALPPFCDLPPTIAAATGETHYMLQGERLLCCTCALRYLGCGQMCEELQCAMLSPVHSGMNAIMLQVDTSMMAQMRSAL